MTKLVPIFILILATVMAPGELAASKLEPKTVQAWDAYVQLTEKRIAGELNSNAGFLLTDFTAPAHAAKVGSALKSGKAYVEKRVTNGADGKPIEVPDGMIHHWFGSIFIPGVQLQSLIQWVQDYDHNSQYFKEVEQSKLISHNGDTFQIFLRLERKKVVTVHYNTEHTVIYRTHAPDRVSSRSFSTKIAEIEDAGSATEKEKPVGNDSGFFWRLNSYWRFKAQDGGVVVECESISLSRSIPFGLAWLIKGIVESVPRESLESTLTTVRDSATGAPNLQSR